MALLQWVERRAARADLFRRLQIYPARRIKFHHFSGEQSIRPCESGQESPQSPKGQVYPNIDAELATTVGINGGHGIFHGILYMMLPNLLKMNMFFQQTAIEWE